ncbi:radical SAM protein [Pectinatus brassicae]|uniref:Pyruvate-formate lyase-activating enzyme n=1 Tax=Pectinatus brassicae TaxID=862415 RepID=A0A840UCY7_9FIRM|nr:radical SAM protein [Pectinatus brassicae]MBB5334936.1 pyruvate-formate lyase-activating enzyme [Pectinatus brassicae]
MSTASITLLYADDSGDIFDAPGVAAMGKSGTKNIALSKKDLIPLPEDAELIALPQRMPLGEKNNELLPILGQAVAAILPAGYIRLYAPAFAKEEVAEELSAEAYTAVALYKGEIYAAAAYTEFDDMWDSSRYNTESLAGLINQTKRDLPQNNLVNKMAEYALELYSCTAQNLFYRRWETEIPVTECCNAKCLNCLLEAQSDEVDSIAIAQEMADVGTYHLSNGNDAVLSFGHNCEGEPALIADDIAAAIKMIRSKTDKGQININTNAGNTAAIMKIVDAGLDRMCVNIISAIPENYKAYYRSDYDFDDVMQSLIYAKSKGVYITLDMLYFPGFNDDKKEAAAWRKFLRKTSVDKIQVRNLNIDPDVFLAVMPQLEDALGLKMFLGGLKGEFPDMAITAISNS